MKHIVGIGANVCDTLIRISTYPAEDTKQQANTVAQCGGGPCATGLAAAAKLGATCSYIGVLTDDPAGKFLWQDLQTYHVSTHLVECSPGCTSFCSYVLLSEDSASRTCVYHRGTLPPLSLSEQQREAIRSADILMVDGNELPAATEAARIAKKAGTKVLYDAGGLYEGVEELLAYTDILIPSEEFALKITGEATAAGAAETLFSAYQPEVLVITQGKKGGIWYNGERAEEYPAFPVQAVDTNGSGDVFHGAFAFAYAHGLPVYDACLFSSAVSAIKCTKIGARAAVPTLPEVLQFLKERGYHEFEEILGKEPGEK